MHQTFYIDIDEEITSIVDRLRKAKMDEIIIVVPKRALLIQSIVNLKLLKKEAEKLKKQIAIVTQDKIGKSLIEKADILVQQKLEDENGEDTILEDANNMTSPLIEELLVQNESELRTKARLENLGSAEYFENDSEKRMLRGEIENFEFEYPRKIEKKKVSLKNRNEGITHQELVTNIKSRAGEKNKTRNAPNLDMFRRSDIELAQDPHLNIKEVVNEKNMSCKQPEKAQTSKRKRFNEISIRNDENKIDNFFQNNKFIHNHEEARKAGYGEVSLSGKFWKYFIAACLSGVLIVVLAVGYLYLPKADIAIFVKTKNKSVEKQIKGDTTLKTVDPINQAIPATIITVDNDFSSKYDVTGSAASVNQKARGIITIYNEFSSNTQPLIATTRFQSADGKIFRLIKGVIVPGKNNIGGEAKAGAIEAEVIADEAGEAYNIAATTFTIPGFKDSGSEKYAKFYAKSFKAMTGGGKGGGAAKSISATDIANAKNKATAEINRILKEKIKDAANSEDIVLDDAINISDFVFALSASENEVADNLTLTAKTKASAIIFNKADLKNIFEKDFERADDAKDQVDKNSLTFQFGKADADFAKGTIIIRVNASVKINPMVDLENLKQGILGKSEDDFKAHLKTYSDIEKASINYTPAFLKGKIPAYASRVSITLDNN